MIESFGLVVGYAGTLTGIVTSVFLFRRARRAEVQSKEIATADQMIDLVKKASGEALELNRKENERLRKSISKLEKAVRAISNCDHRSECPVTERLQGDKDLQYP